MYKCYLLIKEFWKNMSLFIGNLSRDVRAEDIEKAFEAYGKCKVDLRVHFRIRLVTI